MIAGETIGTEMKNIFRVDKILRRCIEEFKLNLSGLVVLLRPRQALIFTPDLSRVGRCRKGVRSNG